MAFIEDTEKLLLDLKPDGEDKIPLDLAQAAQPQALPEQVSRRSTKYDVALGETSPGVDIITDHIRNGHEERMRQLLLDKKRIDFEQQKIGMVQDLVAGAAAEGRPVTNEEREFVYGMTQVDFESIVDAENVLETEYAQKFVNKTIEAEPYIYQQAFEEDPEDANLALDRATKDITNINIVQSLMEDLEKAEKNQSWMGGAWDFAESMVPIWSNSRKNDLTPESESFFTGNNLKETYDYLRALPTSKEFGAEARKIYFTLKDQNLDLAREFLQGLVSYSEGDQSYDNFWDAADIADIALTVAGIKGVKAGARALAAGGAKKVGLKRLESQLRAAASASTSLNPNITKIAQRVGNTRAAAVSRAVKAFESRITGKPELARGIEAVENNIESIWNPRKFLDRVPPNLTKEVQETLVRKMQENGSKIKEFLEAPNVQRTVSERLTIAAQQIYDDEIEGSIRGLKASVLDIDVDEGRNFKIEKDGLTNVDTMVVRLGNKSGSPFANEGTAHAWAKRNKIGDYEVVPFAGKYVINKRYNLPETLDVFSNTEIPQVNLANTGFLNSLFGWIRSPKHVTSIEDTRARQLVTHGTTNLVRLYSEIGKPLMDLSKNETKRLQQALAYNRDYPHPIHGGDRGHWFETVGEMESYWVSKFKELPSDKEILAYQTYRQLNDLDFMVREAGWYRDKARLGINQFDIDFNDQGVKGSLSFEGKEVDGIPESAFQQRWTGVAVLDQSNAKLNVRYTKFQPNEIRQEIAEKLKDGWRLVQVADANLRIPYKEKEVGVGYVLVKDFNKSRLAMGNTYRAGPHVVNRHPFYAKQTQITEGTTGKFIGEDTVVFGAPTEAEARKLVKDWNTAREMLRTNAQGLEEFVAKNLAMDVKDFRRMFKARKNAKGETIPGLRLDIPIVATKSGQRSTDVQKLSDEYIDLSDNPHNLYTEIDRKFSGERDSTNLMVYTRENGNLLAKDEGELFDPLETLTRSAHSMISLRQKRDYFLKSTNDWAEQFRNIIKAPDGDLARNPSRYVFKEGRDLYLDGADATQVRNAENARKAIVRFLGALNREESASEVVKHKVANYVFDNYGSKGLGVIEATWKLPIIKDPLTFGRTIAFHAKLGLGNVQQLFVQSQTMAHAIAISPRNGLKSAAVTPVIRAALINEGMQDWAKGFATKMGWDGNQFDEMMTLLRRSGWNVIQGDVGIVDDLADPPVFNGAVGNTLDFANGFFKEGERSSRLIAWATAYLDRRAMVGAKKMTDTDLSWILDRADNMTTNMSAANNAIWQRGITGVPLQFAAYQVRLFEQYFGKSLSTSEKARLFAMHSALYGVPTAAGGPVLIWPVYESVKSYLTENNIPYDDAVVQSVVQGLPALAMSSLGLDADTAARYGAGGITYLRDWANGDKSLGELAVGASGTVIGDITLAATKPAFGAISSMVHGTPNIYNFSEANLVEALKNVSSVNNGLKLWYAMNYGKWLSKNGSMIDDVTTKEAMFMALTGVTMDRIDQAYTKLEILNRRDEFIKQAEDEVRKAYTRGSLETDPNIRAEYFNKGRALAILAGLTAREHTALIRQSLRNSRETTVESITRRLEEDFLRRGR